MKFAQIHIVAHTAANPTSSSSSATCSALLRMQQRMQQCVYLQGALVTKEENEKKSVLDFFGRFF
jgi:hypothetical protein